MKRPTMLVQALLHQAALDLDLSVERDLLRIEDRCKHEGFSFLTITFPLLSDALEQGLESGTFTCPTSFSRHGRLPRLLGGFFKRVFDKDGRLLQHPCVECIHYIRQICRFFKKLKISCSPERELKAIDHFVAVEGELREVTSLVERKDNILDKVSGILWSQVFPEPDYGSFVCHHGPGVTADRYSANARFRIRKWNHRSEYSFPSDLHCYPNYWAAGVASGLGAGNGTEDSSGRDDYDDGIEYLDLKDEEPVRVVFVPKTQTTPRVIAIEPSHMQYMQQSIKDHMYEVLESHPLTRDSVRFADQSRNQTLAYSSSIDKRLATLDLKDASDRVHLHLVQRIFKTSGLLPYLEDARSLHATLPDGRNVVLTKYASMGSALCFPVESCVFYTLIQSALHYVTGILPSSRSIRHFSRMIDIYGDDLIVPVEYTEAVVDYLESYALKVNVSKSFSRGKFRESCGGDFFNGTDVKPVYAREVPHDNPRLWEPNTVMSWISTADQFYEAGRWHICQVIRDMVRQVVGSPIPRTRERGSGVVHFSYLFTTSLRWNADLQCWRQRRLTYIPLKTKDNIDGDYLACTNKWALSRYRRQIDIGSNRPSPAVPRLLGEARGVLGCSSLYQLRNRSGEPGVGSTLCTSVLSSVSKLSTTEDWVLRMLRPMVHCDERTREVGTRPGKLDELICPSGMGEDVVEPDPLGYLNGRIEGLDFQSSVKRGGFKSKRRWVSLHS